jgi:hypothetical protein
MRGCEMVSKIFFGSVIQCKTCVLVLCCYVPIGTLPRDRGPSCRGPEGQFFRKIVSIQKTRERSTIKCINWYCMCLQTMIWNCKSYPWLLSAQVLLSAFEVEYRWMNEQVSVAAHYQNYKYQKINRNKL